MSNKAYIALDRNDEIIAVCAENDPEIDEWIAEQQLANLTIRRTTKVNAKSRFMEQDNW